VETSSSEIDKWREEDGKSFETEFHAHYKALVVYATTILKEQAEAEDMVQQVFISLWEKRNNINIHTSLRALLYKSVYNACLNRIKQLNVRKNYAKEIMITSETASTSEQLQHKELQLKIETALQQLPEQCAKIFKMSRFEQLKYQEIADQLGLSIKTIENQMGKALKIMREQLKEYLPILFILLSYYYRG
jgi:RNA polymerase sigma-70 factor, ECF subfamily